MNTRKKQQNKFRYIVASILFLVGILLLLIDPIKNKIIKEAQDVNLIKNISREEIVKNQSRPVTYNFDDISPINAINVITNQVDPEELPVVGAIAIPDVELNLPIYLGVSDAGMYMGAGTLVEKQKMGEGNYTLASHHSMHKGLLFEPLMRVEIGNLIYLTDLEKIYTYKIDYIEPVESHRVDLLDETEEKIVTLITCDYDLVGRLAVRGTLISTEKMQYADKRAISAFELNHTVPE